MKRNYRDAILWYAIQFQGDWKCIANALKSNLPYQKINIEYDFVTIVDKEYPDAFRHLRYPPWIFFYQGNILLLKQECIGIVGSRNCSDQAIKNTQIVVNKLKHKYCIVSGLAKGVDAYAHLSSLDRNTIGVIGCGIDQIYPYQNKDLYRKMQNTQLIISEYPMGVKPFAKNFPWRNRLIAALGNALIVIEATMKSGTMLTVNESIELSKPVYCLPTSFNESAYPGCNYLISQGAQILIDEKELEYI